MKQFATILKFELSNYFNNKGYKFTTIFISLILIIGLSIPSFFDLSNLVPFLKDNNSVEASLDESVDEEKDNFVIFDKENLIGDVSLLQDAFINSNWSFVNSDKEVTSLIKSGEADYGFILNNLNNYTYIVNNSTFGDSNQLLFEDFLSLLNRKSYALNNGLDFVELESAISTPVSSQVSILGKNSRENYSIVYLLIFSMYMLILTYGQLIAVSVTSEKSSRVMEVLITSANSTSLIFGKVIGATLAIFIQVGLVLSSGIISYSINRQAWNGILDNVFKIPSNLLIAFILFGGVGFLFYAFIFGALGALVSKTEDISSSITPISLIFIIVFLISILGLRNSESTIIKIASFIPFSSSMTMLIRMAMGSITNLEIIISFITLATSTVLVALGTSKIYRLGSLMYGNPIKLKKALKWFKKDSI